MAIYFFSLCSQVCFPQQFSSLMFRTALYYNSISFAEQLLVDECTNDP